MEFLRVLRLSLESGQSIGSLALTIWHLNTNSCKRFIGLGGGTVPRHGGRRGGGEERCLEGGSPGLTHQEDL